MNMNTLKIYYANGEPVITNGYSWTDKNFEVGEDLYCIYNKDFYDMWKEHITVGRIYKVISTDDNRPDTITIISDRPEKRAMFMPKKFFMKEKDYITYLREEKLKRILCTQKTT